VAGLEDRENTAIVQSRRAPFVNAVRAKEFGCLKKEKVKTLAIIYKKP
jgi:hypothetical protein